MIEKLKYLLIAIVIIGMIGIAYLYYFLTYTPVCYSDPDCVKFICCRKGYCYSNLTSYYESSALPSCSPVCVDPPPTEEFSCSCENFQCVKHTTVAPGKIPRPL